MEAGQIRLITVSREFGAGGSDFAALLGARLDWPVLDHDLIDRVAERLRLDSGTVERLDEHTPGLLARIGDVLIIPQPEMYSYPPVAEVTSADSIAAATRAVIQEAAESLPLIVVGHGAQCIFADRADTLHVRLVAPSGERVSRVMRRMGLDASHAAALVRHADQDRMAYVQRNFHRDVHDDLLYDIRLNSAKLPMAECVAMISAVVRGRAS